MSYAEKPEDITKEEWMDKLNNVHVQRADMNRLIMNYLVTGEVASLTDAYKTLFCGSLFQIKIISIYVLQKDSKRQQKSSGWSPE